jgi:glycosyltransferase involved in cell wall biosynthesis
MRILIERYPAYPALVSRHVQRDPASAFRIAVTAQRIRKSGKRARLAVVHALGGGAAEHVRRIAELTSAEAVWLTLRPVSTGACILECGQEDYRFSLTVDLRLEHETLATVLRACGVERIHIHHLMGHGAELAQLVDDLGLPFDFTAHDYYTLCPQVTMSDEHGRYCNEPDEISCDRCIEKRPPRNGLVDISSWRTAHGWALLKADRVITPCAEGAARISRYHPEARVIAAEHPADAVCGLVRARGLEDGEHLRVALIGTQTIHKGYELLRDCAEAAKREDLPIDFTLIGSVEAAVQRDDDAFTATGRYEDAELAGHLERAAPHIVWFPTRVPETFSYTLSACLEAGLPVAAHDVGAFPERVGARPWSWIVPRETSAAEWVELFLRMRRENFLTGTGPPLPERRERARADFYPGEYLAGAGVPRGQRTAGRRSRAPITIAAAVATDPLGRIQACGYVRVVQPLTHPAVADTLRLSIRPARDLAAAEADVVLAQRVAIEDVESAERVVEACRRRGSRLVFETDDDLFHLPPEHPESEHYARITQGAKRLAKEADAIFTSTEPLRQKLLAWNRNVVVIPNLLDDRLWGPAEGPPLDPDAVRILYAGSVSHRDDLEFLGQAVRKLSRARREKLRIDVIGVTAEGADWHDSIAVPSAVALSYPRYVDWIRRRNVWHWGVAPLLDTPFNRSKSALKFLEYAALGLPSICSDMTVYRSVVRPGETGILAANDGDAWRDALEMALGDEALWRRLREGCRKTAEENTLAARARDVKAAWMGLAADCVGRT